MSVNPGAIDRQRFRPDRLVTARKGVGLSQERLAWRIHTRARNIARWEGGHNKPGIHFVVAIAEATERPIGFFFGEDEDDDEESETMRLFSDLLGRVVDARLKQRLAEAARD